MTKEIVIYDQGSPDESPEHSPVEVNPRVPGSRQAEVLAIGCLGFAGSYGARQEIKSLQRSLGTE